MYSTLVARNTNDLPCDVISLCKYANDLSRGIHKCVLHWGFLYSAKNFVHPKCNEYFFKHWSAGFLLLLWLLNAIVISTAICSTNNFCIFLHNSSNIDESISSNISVSTMINKFFSMIIFNAKKSTRWFECEYQLCLRACFISKTFDRFTWYTYIAWQIIVQEGKFTTC